MKNILTFDIEDWYHPNLADKDLLSSLPQEDRVEAPTLRIINMLEDTNNKATFFVVGDVAEKFPHLVQKIVDSGHEVSSHGYRHNLVYDYTRVQFDTDIGKSVELLSSITGQPVLGYRAPSWSLGKKTPWAWEVLHAHDFIYDSSMYPFETFLYGDNSSPRFDYEIPISKNVSLREFPPSVAEILKRRVPFSGGFFFRIVPYACIKMAIRQYNRRNRPAIIYLHPWEIDVDQPRADVDMKRKFILYANIEKTEAKLMKALREFSFTSIQDYYQLKSITKVQESTA